MLVSLLKIALVLLVFLPAFFRAAPVSAQYYFGKNKVQYTDFDWRVMETEHFKLYFYESERELAEIAARSAEDSYRVLADRFNHHIRRQIPLIIYSSGNYFSQTNVIPALLPENVAGFTEYFKGRVVVPFQGSYPDFQRVIRHELVHVYLSSKTAEVIRAHKKYNAARIPLWFEEGMAEYFSSPWESEAEMVLNDMMITGRFFNLQSIGALSGTYMMYKEGESFCHFLADEYGPESILRILDNWWIAGSFEEIVEATLGVKLEEIDRRWEYWLKKKYFPEFASTDLPGHHSRTLTKPGYSVSPCPAHLTVDGREGDWVVYKANKLGYAGIYMVPLKGGEVREVKTLLKGERSPKFESLHLLRSDLDVSDSGQIVFGSKNKERDRLYILDIETKEITAEFDFPQLVTISSPSWSPDEKRVVFSAAGKDGQVDIYTLELNGDHVPVRRTTDFFNDIDPIFTPDGQAIVFASDRGRGGYAGYTNLFRLDLASGSITPLTCGMFHERQPSYSDDGSTIIFSTDRSGRSNLYALRADGTLEQWTNFTTGAFNPRFSPDGSSVIFTGYQELGFQIFEAEIPDSAVNIERNAPCMLAENRWQPPRIEGKDTRGVAKYRQQFSFDIAQSAISYDAVYGALGGFQTALTDVLGNKQYFFLLSNNTDTKDNFFQSFNASITYIDRTRRVNYGYGLFHLYDDYEDRVDGIYTERQYGGALYLGYPVSKFRRLESSLIIRQSDRDYLVGRKRETLLGTQYVSFIHDNSIWDLTGPIDGYRVRLTFGITHNISDFQHFNRLAIIDARKYIRLGRYSCLALWGLYQTSSGEEPQRRYLGGSWSLRGYPRRAFYGRNVVLFSNELRFPLIDNLFIKFPLARLGFQAIRGAIFFDAGNAWDDDFGRMAGALGVGARVSLGYFLVLRFDFARRTDFKKIDTKTKFDFFFGWNF